MGECRDSGSLMQSRRHINNRSDFNLIVTLRDENGEAQPFPSAPFTMMFQAGGPTRYIVRSDDSKRVFRVTDDNTSLLVVFDFHDTPRLGAGVLRCSLDFDEPNALFPDGKYDFTLPHVLDFELWDGPTDFVGAVTCDLILPYIKGDTGEPGLPGEPGAPGKTAYEYALEGGYDGSEQEFAHVLSTALTRDSVSDRVEIGNPNPVSSNAVAVAVAENGNLILEEGKDFTRAYAQPLYVGSALTSLFEYAGIHYNAKTGYYELNGINDLTEQQAASIFIAGPLQEGVKFQYGGAINKALPTDVRTNLCYPSWFNGTILTEKYRGNVSLEVALIISSRERHDPEANSNYYTILKDTRLSYCFDSCTKLRKVIGVLDCTYVTSGSDGWYCPLLEEVFLKGIVGDFNMKGAPKLSKKTVLYMIRNAAPTKEITVTYHNDVYNMAIADVDIQAALIAQPLVALATV